MTGRGNGAVKTIGFGHAPEHEQHHFVVAIPRAQGAEVMIYEVFERDLVGPELIAANLRCRLDRGRWLKIVDALGGGVQRASARGADEDRAFQSGRQPDRPAA